MPGANGPPGGEPPKDGKDGEDKKKKRMAAPVRTGRRRKKKGPTGVAKTPTILPNAKCKLRLLKMDRVKDFLLLEQEFIKNHEVSVERSASEARAKLEA